MRPRSSILPLAAIATLAAAAPASAAVGELPLAKAFEGSLVPSAGITAAACQASYRPGTPGVATREVTVAPGLGLIETSATGTDGDVDLAIFDASGKVIAAGASPDAQEDASGWTRTGGVLRLQVCRRDGSTGAVRVVVERAWLPAGAVSAKADPPQLVNVVTATSAERNRVSNMGLDLTETAGRDTVGVVIHSAADRTKLRRAGLQWRVLVPDLVASDTAARAADRRFTLATPRSGLPSGRTTYRTLADYESELKALAAANPGLVKLITLPQKTLGGREVLGVEITTDVNVNDGKPVFVNMGVHHAREWPAGENTMEWALELVKGFKAGDTRLTGIVRNSRNIVVPIVNPDGFEASRAAGALAGQDGGRDESVDDTAYLLAGATTGGEYRRKNCRSPDNSETAQCMTSAGIAEPGVDPNRNYGGLWGGPGAAANDLSAQTYRGPGPFSERETQNIKDLVGSRQVMSLVTNHTSAGLILRPPGVASLGDPVDEDRGYKALGDAMAMENGYFSQKSYELYDTTGTTEDWTYNTAGAYSFTFEIYCGAPSYVTGDCDDPAFHPSFARVVEEYEGTSPQADHKADPGRSAQAPFGTVKDYDGKGNREAYTLAAESAIDATRHSVLSGTAPPGTTLRLKKTFKTETFPQPRADGSATPDVFDDSLESTLDVGESGSFRWHVNPSTRPIAAKSRVPEPFQPGQTEAYTLTCERGGRMLDTQQVVVERGEAMALTLGAGCAARSTAPAGTTTDKAPSTTPAACVAGGGFATVGVTPAGRGARFAFTRKVRAKAIVSVFQQSAGRTITGERLVARFTNRAASFTWNGRATQRGRRLTDGLYFVRYTIGREAEADVRRVVLERRGGRFVKRADFHRRATCDALPSFKLERPVFGGRTERALAISFRLANPARVTVTVLRGTKVVKRFGPTQRRAGVTQRLRLRAKGLARGDYRVRISIPVAGGGTLTSTLVGRRL